MSDLDNDEFYCPQCGELLYYEGLGLFSCAYCRILITIREVCNTVDKNGI